jgi:5-methylcytosine-specific restriction endonuclease McrA
MVGVCSYCGQTAQLTLDHIEPISSGGAHDVENAAAVCSACNSSKQVSPLLVWLARRKRDDRSREAAA